MLALGSFSYLLTLGVSEKTSCRKSSFRELQLADIQHPAWLCAVVVPIVITDHDRASIVISKSSSRPPLASCLTCACARSQRGANGYSPVCRRGPGGTHGHNEGPGLLTTPAPAYEG